MVWLFVVAGALVVFVVAAVLVGREAFRLGHQPQSAIFDLEEATVVVGDALAPEVQARVSYDEVRAVILATLERLRALGIGAFPGEELPSSPVPAEVVVADDDALAHVLGSLGDRDDLLDEDVFAVMSALLDHLRHLGAFGPRVNGA